MEYNNRNARNSQGENFGSTFPEGKALHPDKSRDVERVLEALEKQQLDITADYNVWLQLGFALVEGFGEAGRAYFHRLSRIYGNYEYSECDKQYTNCLRSKGSGVSLASFFYLAREAGIRIDNRLQRSNPFAGLKESDDNFFVNAPKEEAPELDGIPSEGTSDFLPPDRKPEGETHVPAETTADKNLQEDHRVADRMLEKQQMEMDKWFSKSGSETLPDSREPALPAPVSPVQAHLESPPAAPEPSVADANPVSEEPPSETPSPDQMPTFPEALYPQLPEFLQRVVAPAENPEERDLLLLGCLGAVSACFPKLFGLYDGKEYRPNLYLFVTAKASAGKGRLAHTKQLVAPIHRKYREENKQRKQEYETELALFNSGPGEKGGAQQASETARAAAVSAG